MLHLHRHPVIAASAVLLTGFSCVVQALSVASTVLVLARDSTTAADAYSGLQGYGIPYEVVTVPSTGVALPTLSSSSSSGNYGGIVVLSEVSYQYANGSFLSALTSAQWQQLFDYQTSFGVRMVRLDVYPSADFGTTPINGNSNDEPISLTNLTGFPTANLKEGASMTTANIYHYPATITNSSIAWEIAHFENAGTAAVINQIGERQQQAWFLPFATDWSATSNFLQHAWIHWLTRGLYVGFRRIYFNTQIDDIFLETDLYQPNGTTFRIRSGDLDAHKSWMTTLNSKLPSGSDYFIELGLNGNGNIEAAVVANDAAGTSVCNPDTAIEYDEQVDTPLEFQKPLGTGTDIWPSTPTNYTWSLACAQLDSLEVWLTTASNRDAFAFVSHTFSHESLNNATYADAYKEIDFNQAWLQQVGFTSAARFSPNGIIPPAITGLHNGDAIRAWMDNGIIYVVGDNTRPVLRNSDTFWPLISTVADNGYAGLTIVPRWATTIYYNCDLPDCTTAEWINTSGGSGTFTDLLADAKATNSRNLLGLHWDPFMFHQANLRQTDVASTTINGVTAQLSLLQIWVETVTQEMTRLTDWPMITLKHDDIAQAFLARMARDQCAPKLTYNYADDGKSIVSVTLTATGNTCSTAIPVTFPGPVTSANGGTTEQVGSDPLTVWATLSGSAQTFTLSTPVAV